VVSLQVDATAGAATPSCGSEATGLAPRHAIAKDMEGPTQKRGDSSPMPSLRTSTPALRPPMRRGANGRDRQEQGGGSFSESRRELSKVETVHGSSLADFQNGRTERGTSPARRVFQKVEVHTRG